MDFQSMVIGGLVLLQLPVFIFLGWIALGNRNEEEPKLRVVDVLFFVGFCVLVLCIELAALRWFGLFSPALPAGAK